MAKIDTTQIEGFDAMSAEEQVQALQNFEYDDHADELDHLKQTVTKANGEAAAWKRKAAAAEKAGAEGQSESEKRIAAMEEEMAGMKKKEKVSEYTARFLAQGYSKDMAASTAQALADGDMETVFANGDAFNAEKSKQMKADLLKQTPRPGVPGATTGGHDYQKKADEAIAAGDYVAASYYLRMKAEQDEAALNK